MVAATYCILGMVYIAISDEAVRLLVHDPEALTEVQTWKGWSWIVLTTVLIYGLVDLSVRAARGAERDRHASDARYRTMIETTNEGVVVADADGNCEYVNQTMANMLGAQPSELSHKRCGSCATEAHRPLIERSLSGVASDGPTRFDCEFKHRDGSSVWTIVSASPIHDPSTGKRVQTLFMVTDITARKGAEGALERNLEMQRLLLNELDHRVRNNLSSLSSLIDLSRSATGSVDEFASIMSGRVQAMAKAHALAARVGPEGLDLARLVAEMIPQVARSRVMIEGPRVPIATAQVVSLAMLLHEIASRSVRSGALSVAAGQAVISWNGARAESASNLVNLVWDESPVTEEPPGGDHADSLIRGLVQRDLRGNLRVRTENDHRVLSLELTINSINDTVAAQRPPVD